MKGNIYVIGDSFVLDNNYVPNYTKNESYWVDILSKTLSCECIIDGQPSRDTQTIIDHWLKLIKHLKKYDFLIICLPFSKRTRLPLERTKWIDTKYPKILNLNSKFIGTNAFVKNCGVEKWLNDFTHEEILEKLSLQEIINSSQSSQINYNEIIESLILLTPCQTFIFSWDEMTYKSDYIKDKNDIIQLIGDWETLNDVWKNTNGKEGVNGDFHWSFDFNKKLAKYILENFVF